MSASDLAPFVAAVIEDGIVAELQHKIEELESKIQRREENHLKVQITGRNGGTTYGEYSLKDCGLPLGTSEWWLDIDVPKNLPCVCPFDEESITQLEIRVGGTVLLKPFLTVDDQFYCSVGKMTGADNVRSIKVVFDSVSINTPIKIIFAHIRLATSTDAEDIFSSLIDSFNPPQTRIQLKQLFDHFDSLINADDSERGGGTKLTMTLFSIVFRKNYISGCISLLDELGVQTTHKGPPFLAIEHEDIEI